MKKSPILLVALFIFACILWIYTIYGENNYAKVGELENNLSWQREHNEKLRKEVQGLKQKVIGLQTDSRKLEQAARNELGMAKEDELIVFFEKK